MTRLYMKLAAPWLRRFKSMHQCIQWENRQRIEGMARGQQQHQWQRLGRGVEGKTRHLPEATVPLMTMVECVMRRKRLTGGIMLQLQRTVPPGQILGGTITVGGGAVMTVGAIINGINMWSLHH